jgi:hypothetical protein
VVTEAEVADAMLPEVAGETGKAARTNIVAATMLDIFMRLISKMLPGGQRDKWTSQSFSEAGSAANS